MNFIIKPSLLSMALIFSFAAWAGEEEAAEEQDVDTSSTVESEGATSAEDAAAAMARALQDALANIKMLATDNTIGLNGGRLEDETNFNFQLQPVYSIPTSEDSRVNYIARAVIPIIGIEPTVVWPPIGPEPTPPVDSTWGLSDTTLQLFISPKSDSAWKWGIGPQVSLATNTSDRTKGPGWGAGIAGVIVGGAGNWGFSAIALYHKGEDDFENVGIQPMIFYNFPNHPGLVLGYNNMITYNVNGDSGQKWNIPLGLTLSKTWALDSGNGFDAGIGYYKVVEHPDNAPDSQIKIALSWIFN